MGTGMTPHEYRAIRETLGLSRPELAERFGCGPSAIKKRETGVGAIGGAAQAQIEPLHDGRPTAPLPNTAPRQLTFCPGRERTTTPLRAARLRLGISQDMMIYQLGQVADCAGPARSTYQAWESGKRPIPQAVLDAAADLEKHGLFEPPDDDAESEAGAGTSVIGRRALAMGAAIFAATIGGLVW